MTYDPSEYQKNKVAYNERQRRYKQKHRKLIAERQREYRKKTPEKLNEYRNTKWRKQCEWLNDYKRGKVCAWCGFKDWRALQFHHKDPSQKEFGIREVIGKISLERIQREIEKCDLICANCHQIYHSPSYDSPNGVSCSYDSSTPNPADVKADSASPSILSSGSSRRSPSSS